MTTVIRNTAKTRRERFVLAMIRRLLPNTPLVVNVLIGPDYASIQGRDGRSVLVDRIAFDGRAYDGIADDLPPAVDGAVVRKPDAGLPASGYRPPRGATAPTGGSSGARQ
jgi:hypothetical protein